MRRRPLTTYPYRYVTRIIPIVPALPISIDFHLPNVKTHKPKRIACTDRNDIIAQLVAPVVDVPWTHLASAMRGPRSTLPTSNLA
jgi:hypothetical protein